MKKKIIWLVIIIAAVFGGYKYFAGKKAVTTYVAENVTRGSLVQTVSATGKLNSNQQIDLSFQATGLIVSVDVNVGDKVVQGQKLATIEKDTFPQQLRQAEADILAQKETLNNMKDIRKTYSKDQRDAQRAVIQKFEAIRDAIVKQSKDTALYSPINGVVIRRVVDPGEVAMVNSPVLVLVDPTDLIIESNIPEADIVKIAVGQKSNITFDALTDKDVFRAEVMEIDPASTVIQDVVFYRVKLKIENVDQRLKVGMSCNDDIVTAEHSNVLMIPERAVKTEGDKQFVDLLRADGITTEKRYMETGLSGDNGMIEVRNNLREGEKVVTFSKAQ